jgi:hypothetical protein
MKLSHTLQKTFVENTRKIVEKNSLIGCLEKKKKNIWLTIIMQFSLI